MKLCITLLLVFAFVSFAGESDNKLRTDAANDMIEINSSAGDITVTTTNIRAVYADIGGKIKVRIKPSFSGSVERDRIITLQDGQYLPITGIIKVYRYTSGTTAATMKITDSTDTDVVGVKLLK